MWRLLRRNATILTVVVAILGVVVAIVGVVIASLQWSMPHAFDPHDLTHELEKQYAADLRKAYQDDLRLDPAEAAALDRFITDHQLQKSSVEAAKKDLIRRIEIASQSIHRGLGLARQRRFSDARQEFLSATQSDPENSAAWADLGAAAMELGRVEEGRNAYDKALVLDPEDWRTRFNFGLFYARVKNPDAALEQFQQVFHPNKRGKGPSGKMLTLVLRNAETDPALGNLRKDPRFQNLLKVAKNER